MNPYNPNQPPGYPYQQGYPPQSSYPQPGQDPQHTNYPPGGFTHPGYPVNSYPPQPGYSQYPQQGYPPQHSGYPSQQPGYPQQTYGYPQQPGYPQPGYPQQYPQQYPQYSGHTQPPYEHPPSYGAPTSYPPQQTQMSATYSAEDEKIGKDLLNKAEKALNDLKQDLRQQNWKEWDKDLPVYNEAAAKLTGGPWMNNPAISKSVANIQESFVKTEKEAAELRERRAVNDATSSVSICVSELKNALLHQRFETVVEKIAKMRELLTKLQTDFPNNKTAVEYVASKFPEADKYEQEMNESKFKKEINQKNDKVFSVFSQMDNSIMRENWADVDYYMAELQDALKPLRTGELSEFQTAKDYVAKAEKRLAETEAKVSEKRDLKTARDLASKLQMAMTYVDQTFDRQNWKDFDEYVEAAKTVMSELENSKLAKHKVVVESLERYKKKMDEQLQKAEQLQLTKKVRDIASNLHMKYVSVDQSLIHSRWSDLDEYVVQVKEYMDQLREMPYVNHPEAKACLANYEKKLLETEATVFEKRDKKEVEDMTHKIEMDIVQLSNAKQRQNFADWDEYLEGVKTKMYELQAHRLGRHAIATQYLDKTFKKLEEWEPEVKQLQLTKKVRDLAQVVFMRFVSLDQAVLHQRWNDVDEYTAQVNDALEAIKEIPYVKHPEGKECIEKSTKKLAAIEEEVLEKRDKQVAQKYADKLHVLITQLENAKLRQIWNDCDEYMTEARTLLSELESSKLAKHPIGKNVLESGPKKLNNIEAGIVADKLTSQVREKTSRIHIAFAELENAITREHWNDIDEYMAKAEEAMNALREFPFARHPEAISYLPKSEERLKTAEQTIFDKRDTNAARSACDKIENVIHNLSQAKIHERWMDCDEYLDGARARLAELQKDRIAGHPITAEYIKTTTKKLDEWEPEIVLKKLQSRLRDQSSTLTGKFAQLEHAITTEHWSNIDEYYAGVEDVISALKSSDLYVNLPEAREFTKKNEAKLLELQSNVSDKKDAKAAKDEISKLEFATIDLRQRKDAHKWDETDEFSMKARDTLYQLTTGPLSKNTSVIAAVQRYTGELDKIDAEILELSLTDKVRSKISTVDIRFSELEHAVKVGHWANAEEYLEVARAAVDELKYPPFAGHNLTKEKLEKSGKRLSEIETEIIDKKFAEVVKKAIGAIEMLIINAKNAQSAGKLDDAAEHTFAAKDAIQDLEFSTTGKHPLAVEFVKKSKQDVQNIDAQITEQRFANQIRDHKSRVELKLTEAKIKLDGGRYDDSVELVIEAADRLFALEQYPFNTVGEISDYVKTTKEKLNNLEATINEEKFGKKARSVMENISLNVSLYENAANTANWTVAERYLITLRDLFAAHHQGEFVKLETFKKRLAELNAKTNSIESLVSEKRDSEAVRDAISRVDNAITQVKLAKAAGRWEDCNEDIVNARDLLSNLSTGPLSKHPNVPTYAKKATEEINKQESEMNEKKFAKELSDLKSKIDLKHTEAKTRLENSRFDDCLEKTAEISDLLKSFAEAPYNTVPAAVSYANLAKSKVSVMEDNCAQSRFGAQAKDLLSKAELKVLSAEYSIQQEKWNKASEDLEAAFDAVGALKQDNFLKLESVRKFIEKVDAKMDALENSIAGRRSKTPEMEAILARLKSAKPAKAGEGEEKPAAAQKVAPFNPATSEFPKGYISETLGAWVPNRTSGMVTLTTDPAAPVGARAFINTWNQTAGEIDRAWNKYITQMNNAAKFTEDPITQARFDYPFGAPAYQIELDKFYEPVDRMVKQFLKDFDNRRLKVEDDKTPLTKQMFDQTASLQKRWEENLKRAQKIGEFLSKYRYLCGIAQKLQTQSAYGTPAGAWRHLLEYSGSIPLGPLQADVKEKIAMIDEYQARHPGYSDGGYDKNAPLTRGNADLLKLGDILRTLFRKAWEFYKEPAESEAWAKTNMKPLEKYPFVYEAVKNKFKMEWDRLTTSGKFSSVPFKFPENPNKNGKDEIAVSSELVELLVKKIGVMPEAMLIKPGSPEQTGLPLETRELPTSKTQGIDQDVLNEFGGKFLFSTEEFAAGSIIKKETLKNNFTWEEVAHGIYARGFWKTKVANYPVAVDMFTKKPIYVSTTTINKDRGPRVKFVLTAKIDGKLVQGPVSFMNEATDHSIEAGNFFLTNGYRFAPTGTKYDDELFGRRLIKGLVDAGAGDHKVDVDISFMVCCGNSEYWDYVPSYDFVWPFHSLVSHPIAKGEFTVQVPSGAEIPDIYGPDKQGVEEVPLAAIKTHLRSQVKFPVDVIWSKCVLDWTLAHEAYETTEWRHDHNRSWLVTIRHPAEYCKKYHVLVYFNPEKGWRSRETVQEWFIQVNVNNKPVWSTPISPFAINGGHSEPFEVEYLPKAAIERIPDRCDEKYRFKYMDEPHAYFNM